MASRFSLVEDIALNDEAEQVQMMADMAQIVAHRIRGLVTTIEGFTDLLADMLPGREQRELALRIFEGAARIESVLADLQMFARPVHIVPAATTAGAILADLYAAVHEDVVGRFDIEMGGSDVELRVDRMLIRQVLLVLVQNAADATTAEEMISLDFKVEGREVCFNVRNPGEMHPDVEKHAFKPFFTTKAHNLGVGLPIAARIARAHGGSIRLTENDVEAGTCFTLVLPRDQAGEVEP